MASAPGCAGPGGTRCGNDARARGTVGVLSAAATRPRVNLWARGDDPGRAIPGLTCPSAAFSTIHNPYYGHWTENHPSVKESEHVP
jgi:hypothetical protein